MRKGVFIIGLIAVTIIAASLAATPASACHPNQARTTCYRPADCARLNKARIDFLCYTNATEDPRDGGIDA
jgi:hypothetical protein